MKAELVQVIRSEHQRGRGSAACPLRTVVSYHLPDGTLIAEEDPQRAFDESDELANARQALVTDEAAIGNLQRALEQAIEQVHRHNRSAGQVTKIEALDEWRRALDESRARHRAYAIGVPSTDPGGG